MHKYAAYVICAIVVVVLIIVGTKNNGVQDKGDSKDQIDKIVKNDKKTKLIRSKREDEVKARQYMTRKDQVLSNNDLKASYNRKDSEGEKECRRVLMDIYGLEFPNVRPDWLKNPKTLKCLEIDCYNNELKIGVEYNGAQHYIYPNKFHKTRKQFDDQQYRDMVKIEICKKLGIHLISVPYKIDKCDIRKYISDRLPRHDYIYDGIN